MSGIRRVPARRELDAIALARRMLDFLPLLFALAGRQIWRSPLRSSVTIAAFGLTLAGMIGLYAIVSGLFRQMQESVTDRVLGGAEFEISVPSFPVDRERTLRDAPTLEAGIRARGYRCSSRLFGLSLVEPFASDLELGAGGIGVRVVGISPERERDLSPWMRADSYQRGRPLRSRPDLVAEGGVTPQGEIVVGSEIASILHLDPGDWLSLYPDGDEIRARPYVIAGILDPVDYFADRTLVLVDASAFRDQFEMEDGEASYLAVRGGGDDVERSRADLERGLEMISNGGLAVRSWRELSPQTAEMIEFEETLFGTVVSSILMIALGGIIFNIMLTGTYERLPELGLMKALGLDARQMFLLSLLEASLLACVGSLIGVLLGWAVVSLWLEPHGITVGGFSVSGAVIEDRIFARWVWGDVARHLRWIWLVAAVSAVWPAYRASAEDPKGALERAV